MTEPSATGAYLPTPGATPPERFPPGSLLAGRYRIVLPLGKGGMGEVYRADDLTLGQPVALKFLPQHLASDPDRLNRFRKEVAAARRVSHPNVCRVYDIVEHAGHQFLTMEFVDGEDLSSVLKRLGRLPEEKGLEVARQMCSALAAVHDQGLLHRDLKPANIMLDGRGRVRLTDFGLAAAAEDLSASEVRSGTPLYQAPEQRTGREVTACSDLYSLGLVLYELFTGRRPYPGPERDGPPSKPSSHVTGLDQAIERVILRCLATDPADRPRSAAEVLTGLPGGDPLAAAMAAGQTPLPQLVAAADPGDGKLPPWIALALVAVIAAGIVVSGWLGGLNQLAPRAGMRDAEPALMRHKAREVLAILGHDEPPADTAVRYLGNHDFLDYAQANDPAPDVWDSRWIGLDDGRPPAMLFFYRSARRPLGPTNHHYRRETPGQIDPLNPPPLEPGMVDVTLDLRGRLLRFHKVADFLGPESPPAAPAVVDWRPVFTAAGLDYAAFAAMPVPPRHQPPLAADARYAWEGPYPDARVNRVRVETASLSGKPVYFKVEFPWDEGDNATAYVRPYSVRQGDVIFFAVVFAAIALGCWNWRVGRGDLRGASLVAGVQLALWFFRWMLTAHHVTDYQAELTFEIALGTAVYNSALVAVFYLALEPIVRKRWPWRLVGWNRLLAGRIRDPLVARDVLIGLAAGTLWTLVTFHLILGPVWAPELVNVFAFGEFEFDPTRCVVNPLTMGVQVGFLYFFIYFLCHWVCRDYRLGTIAVLLVILFLALNSPNAEKHVTVAITIVVTTLGLQFIAMRFGLLAFVSAMLPIGWLFLSGWTLDVRAWYAFGPNLGVAVMAALTLYATYTATSSSGE